MKQSTLAWFAILSAIPASATANSENDIVAVAPSASIDQWVATFSNRLDRSLRYPTAFREPVLPGGVAVTFRSGADGEPDAIHVLRPSGNARLDRAAVSAIKRLKTLHPLPIGLNQNQVFQANIVFATDERSLAREAAALQAAVRQSRPALAANGHAPLVIGVQFLK